MKIAVDAMGGDFAPVEIVKGALVAAQKFPEVTIVLAGDFSKLELEINKAPIKPANIEIVPASQVIAMSESPVEAIKGKQDSSLLKCIELVRKKEASALISAGNTGALVAGSTMMLGFLSTAKRQATVKRPGIAVPLPTKTGVCYLIDAGANIHCNPVHLLQYAIMASIYCEKAQHIPKPRVGVLNIGEEDTKGTELVKETHVLLKKSGLNFIGNIEGQDIFKGNCDVIVCEGFVGNVLLKSTEGFGDFIKQMLAKTLEQTENKEIVQLIYGVLGKLLQRVDYAEYGGALVLGLNGIIIKCHGRSNARAIENGIKVAVESAKHNLNEEIIKYLNSVEISWLDVLKSWRASR